MNHRVTTMLASDTVSRREERLRAVASLAEAAHSNASATEKSRRGGLAVSTARRWAGHALTCGGRALSRTGERIAGDRGATLVTHG
jgi:hypothetical protein